MKRKPAPSNTPGALPLLWRSSVPGPVTLCRNRKLPKTQPKHVEEEEEEGSSSFEFSDSD